MPDAPSRRFSSRSVRRGARARRAPRRFWLALAVPLLFGACDLLLGLETPQPGFDAAVSDAPVVADARPGTIDAAPDIADAAEPADAVSAPDATPPAPDAAQPPDASPPDAQLPPDAVPPDAFCESGVTRCSGNTIVDDCTGQQVQTCVRGCCEGPPAYCLSRFEDTCGAIP
jgi:hypothetical protein